MVFCTIDTSSLTGLQGTKAVFCLTMEIVHVYTKKRCEFGRPCLYSVRPAELHVNVISEPHMMANFLLRNPCDNAVQCAFEMSEHEVSILSVVIHDMLVE